MAKIFEEFVVLKPDLGMDQLPVGDDFYEKLDANYAGFAGHTLVSAHHFSESWGVWEIHPKGDELVILLTGRAEFVLKTKADDESLELTEAGAMVVVPANTWHTAIINEPTSMLFVTPGEGTQNETSPEVGR